MGEKELENSLSGFANVRKLAIYMPATNYMCTTLYSLKLCKVISDVIFFLYDTNKHLK